MRTCRTTDSTVAFAGVTKTIFLSGTNLTSCCRFIAEFANTISNIPFLLMATFGIRKTLKHHLPLYLALPFVGTMLIGIGSFLFHATVSPQAREHRYCTGHPAPS